MSTCKRSTDLVNVSLGRVKSTITVAGPLTSCQYVKVPELPRWLSRLVTTVVCFSVKLQSDKIRRSCEQGILHWEGWWVSDPNDTCNLCLVLKIVINYNYK